LPKSPLLAEAYYRLGTIQYNILQDFDRAQILLKTALKNNPPKNLKLKIIEQLINVYIGQGKLNEASDFLSENEDPSNLGIVKQKKILITLLSTNIDSVKNLVDFELEGITPDDPYFNDLIELNEFLTRYTKKNTPSELKSFKHFIKAEFLIRQRKITEAISELEFISDKYSQTEIAPLSAFRQALLLKKIQQFDAALNMSMTLEKTWIADRSIILTGQIYELNFKDKEKAISKYMQILNDYKSSIYAEPIRYHIRELQNLTAK
jgi:tetratricopeptide (TPR) repeat protein